MRTRSRLTLLAAALTLLASGAAEAHPVTADGDPSEWLTRSPSAANLGIIARDAMGRGEYVWRDATADTRTDLATPEVVADLAAFQVTGSPTGLAFLVRRQSGVTFSGQPIQVQIAIDTDRVAGSGQDFLAGFADTLVADAARWERLVQTLFGSGGKAQVIDTAFNKVGDAEAAVGAGGEIEIFVPWSALGMSGPPSTPLRFTVATFRAQNNDLTVDVGGAGVSNVLDAVSDYGDPAVVNYPNTWTDVMDQVVDYHFDLWFDPQGEVTAPVVVQRFLANDPGSASGEWYAVRNTTGATIALDNYKLGNEATPDGAQGMFSFPAGASLAPGASFTVARAGAAYQAYFGAAPDAELPPDTLAGTPDMAMFAPWASGAVQLADAGDELLVLDPSNTILDVAVYGNGAYPGVNAYTPAPAAGDVLARDTMSSDTDDCLVDFSDAGQACTADAQCGGTCFECAGNVCGPKPMGAPCPDANPCDGDEVCDGNGACVASTAPPCDDQNPCTTDACAPGTGCSHTPLAAGTSCSDGDICNGVEVCDANAVCQPGTALDCADTDPCTVDACDAVMGCQHQTAADGASCSDGDACNGVEVCMGGACMPGTAPVCDDQNPCTTDACDSAAGCTFTAVSDGTSCADADVCNGTEVCVGGTCASESPLDCDDQNDCTVDSCDAQGGCQHAHAADGTACAGAGCNGTCAAGSCMCGAGGAGGGMGSSSSSASSSSSSASSSSSSTSAGGEGGDGGSGGTPLMDSACGCRAAGDAGDESAGLWMLSMAAAGVMSRRRRRR